MHLALTHFKIQTAQYPVVIAAVPEPRTARRHGGRGIRIAESAALRQRGLALEAPQVLNRPHGAVHQLERTGRVISHQLGLVRRNNHGASQLPVHAE